MKKVIHKLLLIIVAPSLLTASCKEKLKTPSRETINELKLNRGELILCGPDEKKFGATGFDVSGSEKMKADFNLAIALLHSFEYDESEKVFAKIIDENPGIAMAYWGVAMCNYHPLWAPPNKAELEKGAKAISIARELPSKSKRETSYINAISLFYDDWENTDHRTRSIRYKNALQKMHDEFPDDNEAAIFFALALTSTADPSDKTFKNQMEAGKILNALADNQPNHPGMIHYIIHTYDSPELAELALPAARKYASIAPSSAHALHMPSHIFTRLGLWDECLSSNHAAAASALCYAQQSGFKGHIHEEVHSLDYLAYAYLQKGDNKKAKSILDYLNTIDQIQKVNFAVAYAFAAIPSRYLLENKLWKEAAELKSQATFLSWKDYPWQNAIIHFTRLLGSIHTKNLSSAKLELKSLQDIHDTLLNQKDAYKANQVQIQIKASEAWIAFTEGKKDEAIKLMTEAAEMEDRTEKHAVTPGEVLPARELLGDMLLQLNRPAEALTAYEADLKKHPGRFNGLYGAALAAEKSNNTEKAIQYYKQLLTNTSNSDRPEVKAAKLYLDRMSQLRLS